MNKEINYKKYDEEGNFITYDLTAFPKYSQVEKTLPKGTKYYTEDGFSGVFVEDTKILGSYFYRNLFNKLRQDQLKESKPCPESLDFIYHLLLKEFGDDVDLNSELKVEELY